MKVEVVEKVVVRPHAPTPQSLRKYKLSLLDQFAGTHDSPFVFFYNSVPHDYKELKKSLSKTLSVLYPLAGRIRDGITVECNDEGAEFAVAEVRDCDLGDILQHPKLELLQKLVPRDPYPPAFDPDLPMLAVQVNRFRCGGTAIGISLWHALADGAAVIGFLETWAGINQGDDVDNWGGLLVDTNVTTTIFPPKNINLSKSLISPDTSHRKYGTCTKRFVFRAEAMERLRNDYNKLGNHGEQYWSRAEALAAFVWIVVLRATLKAYPNLKMHYVTPIVNIRKRMNPPFPSTCLGNLIHMTLARWDANGIDDIDKGSLLRKVREAIGKVTNDYMNKLYVNDDYYKAAATLFSQIGPDEMKGFCVSSLFNFPFHKVDFGWGRPIWMCLPHTWDDMALFMDTDDGGVELWLGLPPQIMRHLDKDNEFLAYEPFSQIIWEPPYLSARL